MSNKIKKVLDQFESLTSEEQESFIEQAVKILTERRMKEAMEEINKMGKQ